MGAEEREELAVPYPVLAGNGAGGRKKESTQGAMALTRLGGWGGGSGAGGGARGRWRWMRSVPRRRWGAGWGGEVESAVGGSGRGRVKVCGWAEQDVVCVTREGWAEGIDGRSGRSFRRYFGGR